LGHALAQLLLPFDLGVQLGAEQQRNVREPEPADEQYRSPNVPKRAPTAAILET
jgi:hypothetical protein